MKRFYLHLSFWLVFFCISLYNELYYSESFSVHPSWELFGKAVLVQVLIYIIKIGIIYYLLYAAIPNLLNTPYQIKAWLKTIGVILFGTLLIRLMIQNIIWIYVNGENPVSLGFTKLLARYFYSLLDLAELSGIAAAIKLFRSRLAAIEKEKNLTQEKAKAEILHLKAQTNPHFLFNTLNSIFALARNQSQKTPEAIIKLSKILRYMLYETKENASTLAAEWSLINDYISLQQLRFQQHIKIKKTILLENEQTKIAPLLLLPLVENAFKYCNGARNKSDSRKKSTLF
jgi:two-component system, LytTR family, sensor kinase